MPCALRAPPPVKDGAPGPLPCALRVPLPVQNGRIGVLAPCPACALRVPPPVQNGRIGVLACAFRVPPPVQNGRIGVLACALRPSCPAPCEGRANRGPGPLPCALRVPPPVQNGRIGVLAPCPAPFVSRPPWLAFFCAGLFTHTWRRAGGALSLGFVCRATQTPAGPDGAREPCCQVRVVTWARAD